MIYIEDQFYLDKIKSGERSFYSFLVDRYKDIVYAIALKILGDPEDAGDAAQECFIKAFSQIHQFKGNAKFSTWLYTIIYRIAVSKLKENRIATVTITEDHHNYYTSGHSENQSEQLQAKQTQYYVRCAIEKLPYMEGLLVTLHYINDLSIREVGEITGLSMSNIKIKLFRARKKLERDLTFLL